MVTLVVKRIGFMIFTMIIVSLILFLLLETELTGDPAIRVLGQFSNEEQREMWREQLRLPRKLLADNAKELSTAYGRVSSASVGAIQRRLLMIEREGAEDFFGEPTLDVHDLMRTGRDGFICAHAVAICVQHAEQARAAEEEQERKREKRGRLSNYVWETSGKRTLLPPNRSNHV